MTVCAAPRAGFVPGDGLRLRCYEWGEAGDPEPIILLHGITESALSWRTVAEALAPRHRVIALDARGHGQSGWSAGEEYAPDHHFADLALALPALGVRRCTLAGYSMGGAVAIMAAACLPEHVGALVVVDAYPDPLLSPGSLRIARFLARLYPNVAAGLPARFDPAIARRMRDDLLAGTARRLDLWPFWECAGVPALLVRGAESDVLTAAKAREMVARRSGTRLVTLPGVAHQVPARRPLELARYIDEIALAGR